MARLPATEPRLCRPARSPWSPAYTPGGSSGGSAAAVASAMVPMAHGGDGGGSIRIPASCCGLFGLKPTRARTPLGPDLGEAWSGAGVGHAVTRSVRDSAALLDATAGPDIGDPYWAPPPKGPYLAEVGADPGPLRIAFTATAWNGQAVHPECAAAVMATAKLCERLGHQLEEASPAIDETARTKAVRIISAAHTRAAIETRAEMLGRTPTPDDVEPITWQIAELGRSVTASDYARSIGVMHRTGRAVGRFF